jgi:hypothetical protein
MERPKPEPPLDVRPFLELVDERTYPCRSGSVNAAGQSSTAVLLVFGPDAERWPRSMTAYQRPCSTTSGGSRPRGHPRANPAPPLR